MTDFTRLANDSIIEKTVSSLKANGFDVIVAKDSKDAFEKVTGLVPANAEVMTMTSITLEETGLNKEFNESGKYDSVRKKLNSMDRATQGREMRKLGAAPDYVIGSVHAITQDGHVLVASASGSQLPAYAYAGGKVIWVASTQKIVDNIDQAYKRLKEHVFALENQRAMKAYGVGSSINKTLVINKEAAQGRVTIVLVKEKLGF